MMNLVVDALASFRITKLVVEDSFPPVQKARDAALSRYDDDSWQAYLLSCPWCIGFWIGLAVAIARVLVPNQWDFVARVFATSAVTGLLSER